MVDISVNIHNLKKKYGDKIIINN
ncbi:ABC transporter ATP-binding protein, partial [Listeria monocytogenes]|nr:ABC transporter ATP-binding protein [Listeria monocytogenes]